MKYNAMQCNAMQCNAMQCDKERQMQCRTIQNNTMQYSEVLWNVICNACKPMHCGGEALHLSAASPCLMYLAV